MKTIIDASDKGYNLKIKELIAYKDMLLTLTRRDFKVRYAQSYLGILWVIAQPAINILFAYFILGATSAGMSTELKLIYSSSAVALWTYFAFVFEQAGGSIIASQQMVKKIYFPRLILPVSKAFLGLFDFFVALTLLIAAVVAMGYMPSDKAIFGIVFVLIAFIASLGIGLWISAMSIRYRDFKYATPFLVRVGYMVSPIIYTSESITGNMPKSLEFVYFVNPMAGAIDGFRWSITGIGDFNDYWVISAATGLVLLLSGLVFFKRVERKMADWV